MLARMLVVEEADEDEDVDDDDEGVEVGVSELNW